MNGPVPQERRRLEDLLRYPQEALDVEIKSWLNLAENNEHKAQLAKALLALANHGGGHVIIGLEETEAGFRTADERPETLGAYSQDKVNGIVHKYAEPPFHCSVHHVLHPTSGVTHPIIGVPGNRRVPIRAKRSGPEGRIIRQHTIYIRRPGPQSAQPETGREWDALFGRCLQARRDELLDHIRDLMIGRPSSGRNQTELSRLDQWVSESEVIWQNRISELPPDSPARCPHGFFTFAYHVDDGNFFGGLADLREMLGDAPRLTGWPPWWVPTRLEIEPYARDGALECWLGNDPSAPQRGLHDAAHADFWRITPDGLAFLLRGYEEDGIQAQLAKIQPDTIMDPLLPIWRVGEALQHAAFLADRLGGNSISFVARYTGLLGRRLVPWASPVEGAVWARGTCRDDAVSLSTNVGVDTLSANLAEVVHELLSPLYERFSLTRLPYGVVQHELNLLLKRKRG